MTYRIFVEGWEPEFGASFGSGELEPSTAGVDPNVEIPESRWKPLPPRNDVEARDVSFVDGVRRIDALVWIRDETTEALHMGLCASCAAGMVAANTVTHVVTGRYLFTAANVPSLETSVGPFRGQRVEGVDVAALSSEVQTALRELETEVARQFSPGEGLVVVDGPLSKEHTRAGLLGYVKTHRVSYLDESLTRTVHALRAGERTPLFLTSTSWERYSCYLRLPGGQEHPWAGMVRLEVAGDRSLPEAKHLVNAAQALLPRYASVPHKEPRAPQNLFPIGGLERELRRRLGDARLVHRAIRVAAGR